MNFSNLGTLHIGHLFHHLRSPLFAQHLPPSKGTVRLGSSLHSPSATASCRSRHWPCERLLRLASLVGASKSVGLAKMCLGITKAWEKGWDKYT